MFNVEGFKQVACDKQWSRSAANFLKGNLMTRHTFWVFMLAMIIDSRCRICVSCWRSTWMRVWHGGLRKLWSQ